MLANRAAEKIIKELKLHAHAGIVGWFIQLITGVGSRLLPMFMASYGLDSRNLIFNALLY